jgi:hypothetical protein
MIRSHRATHKHRAYLAVLVVPALMAGAYFAAAPSGTDAAAAAPVDLHVPLGLTPDDLGQWCVDAQQRGTSGLSASAIEWLKGCAESFGRHPQTPEPTPSSTTAPGTPTTAPTTSPSTTMPTPTQTTPAPTVSGWPNATNTGVPAGTALTAYTGPCTITAANTVIDAKTVGCDLTIRAVNVTITRSHINGSVGIGNGGGLSIADTTIVTAPNTSGLDGTNFTATRLDVSGGNRGSWCMSACTIRDSYFHGQRISAGAHASAVRMEQNGSLIHNTLLCDPVVGTGGGACSADLTMYPDFVPIHDVKVLGNHLVTPPGSYYCSYGGGTAGKPYSTDPSNATNMVFRDNVFDRGPWGACGGLKGGAPISGWKATNSGNTWAGNVWSDGVPLIV